MNKGYLGDNIPKLGFGLMRLPMIGEEIDMEQTISMVDTFMQKGFTYFDTAYVYINGKSEVAAREALVKRYPRDSFTVATKLPLWDNVETEEDMQRIFDTSMERLGVDYIDFYLLHAMDKTKFEKADAIGAWDFIFKMKEQGKIRHCGFSFHDSADVLDEALTKHPEAEFVQLQINYLDWESDNVQARKCYEVCLKHNKPIVVMEPIKGGSLASMAESAQSVLTNANPDASVASWAVRYCAGLDNIVTVLSGMSTQAQMDDNVSYMENFQPLSEEESATLNKAIDALNAIPTIPCTACRYCVDDCPQQINIPEIFKAMNGYKQFGNAAGTNKPFNQWNYNRATKDGGKASDCIQCGSCEAHCPQHINIIEELKAAAAVYEA
ncbi:MAG: aldo/keto reductase [Clostridia bacterium]|nr:aldo/keto reductase [Clostridia bacterium]